MYNSEYHEDLKNMGGLFCLAIVEQAQEWFRRSGACLKNPHPSKVTVPEFSAICENWGGVIEYMSVFPVRLQYQCNPDALPPQPFRLLAKKDKIVVVDVGAGVGSTMYASRRIREYLALKERDGRDWVFLIFETDGDALLLLKT